MSSNFKWIIAIAFAFATTELLAQNKLIEYYDDLDSLRVWIDEIHPWPYSRCTKAEVDSAFLSAHESINSSTGNLEFSKIIGSTLGVFSDSHTLLNIEQFQYNVASEKGIFSLSLRYIEGKFYSLYDPYDLVSLGSEIVKINGVPTIEYFNSALTIVPTEGNSYTSKVRLATILLNDFVLYQLEDVVSSIKIETSAGEVIDYPITQLEKSKKIKSVVDWVWPEDGSSIAKLKISSFYDGNEGRYYRELKRGFKKLKDSEFNHLVIDLRGNLGGNAIRVDYLLSYITQKKYAVPEAFIFKQCTESKENFSKPYKGILKWFIEKYGDEYQNLELIKRTALLEVGQTDTIFMKPENFELKHIYNGEVCLLMDGLSASASVSFASAFKKLGRGQIMGEPCMGPITGTFGNPITRTLPNSELDITISSIVFALDSNLSWHSTPISPNRFIQVSPNEMTENIDPFQFALDDWYKYPHVSNSNDFKTRENQILFSELETVYSLNRTWGGQLRSEVFDIIVECDNSLDNYNKKIKEVEKSDASEDEILLSVTELYKTKKVSVDMRNAKIKLKLPLELRTTFEQLTAPNRPAVLHFGIHNRADCNVCKK